MKHNLHAIREGTMKVVFLLTACISILAVALICIFLFANGIPTMHKIGLGKFLFGMTWAPNQNLYGIFPMIIASILVTGGAILIGVPLGLLCALYLARFCPKRLYSVLKPAVDLLAGIPSIVYGFFGLVVLVPALQAMFGSGKSIVTASIMLGIMILPTIISVSESSLRAVPESYYEGSLALGATHERSVFSAVFPAARSATYHFFLASSYTFFCVNQELVFYSYQPVLVYPLAKIYQFLILDTISLLNLLST